MADLVDLMPSAKDLRKELALAESKKASEEMRRRAAAEAEKKSLIDHLTEPSGVSDEEALRRGAKLVRRAIEAGLTEVQVYRFPNQLCTDHGRAIIQQEQGWEQTLTGVPKEIYMLWDRHLRPRGYKLKAQIIDYPNGVPGDIGMTLSWV